MISVIICSRSEDQLVEVRANIADTIGVPHEIIAIDNRDNHCGITSAYNEGAAVAQYGFLCFVHEDIKFLTGHWGDRLITHLSSPDTGLIGVAGSPYKSVVPSSWSAIPEMRIAHIFQASEVESEKYLLTHGDFKNDPRVPVIVVDGVFLGTKKSVWKDCHFDESVLRGFHGYDIDFSLQVSQRFSIFVVNDIPLEHRSQGNRSKAWLDSTIALSQKWARILPSTAIPLSKSKHLDLHQRVLNEFARTLFSLNFHWFAAVKLVFRFGCFAYPALSNFALSLKLMVYLIKNMWTKGNGHQSGSRAWS